MKGPSVDSDSGARPSEPSSISTNLLLRVQAEDPDAWRRLVRLCGPVVYGWCRRAGLSAEDAADVGQDVFLAVLKGVSRFRRDRPDDSFRGWLWTITQHKVSDYWRRHAAEPGARGGSSNREWLTQLTAEDELSGTSNQPQIADGLHRVLELVRGEFEARTWQAFWRVTVDGQSPASVAADLAMSPGAVYIAKSRVLRRLRDEFADLVP